MKPADKYRVFINESKEEKERAREHIRKYEEREQLRRMAREKREDIINTIKYMTPVIIAGIIIIVIVSLVTDNFKEVRQAEYRHNLMIARVQSGQPLDNIFLEQLKTTEYYPPDSSKTKELRQKLKKLHSIQREISGRHEKNAEIFKRFIRRERDVQETCQKIKSRCGITSYDEAKLGQCPHLLMALQEYNKILRYKSQMLKILNQQTDMLFKISFLQRSLYSDIDFIDVVQGDSAAQSLQAVEEFLKEYAELPPADISNIDPDKLPTLSLTETWKLIQ